MISSLSTIEEQIDLLLFTISYIIGTGLHDKVKFEHVIIHCVFRKKGSLKNEEERETTRWW